MQTNRALFPRDSREPSPRPWNSRSSARTCIGSLALGGGRYICPGKTTSGSSDPAPSRGAEPMPRSRSAISLKECRSRESAALEAVISCRLSTSPRPMATSASFCRRAAAASTIWTTALTDASSTSGGGWLETRRVASRRTISSAMRAAMASANADSVPAFSSTVLSLRLRTPVIFLAAVARSGPASPAIFFSRMSVRPVSRH